MYQSGCLEAPSLDSIGLVTSRKAHTLAFSLKATPSGRTLRNASGFVSLKSSTSQYPFLDGYCSTVQGLLNRFEVDLGFAELLFIQIDLCVMCVFVLYSPLSLSS